MKKAALIMSFLLTVCSFTACGNTEEKSSEGAEKTAVTTSAEETTEAETTTEAEETEEETTEADTTEAEDKDAEKDSEETTAADSDSDSSDEDNSKLAAAENTDFKRGVVDGDVYTSEYGGIKFKAPEGWTFAKDDYILSLMNIGLDVLGDDTAMTKAMLDQVAIYDALCMDQTTGQNIIIEYENLAKEVPDPDKFTMNDYFDAIDKMLTTMSTVSYKRAGEPEEVTLAGQTYTKVVYTADYSGQTIEQTYYARRVGKFMQAIAMSGTSGEDMTKFENCFEALS